MKLGRPKKTAAARRDVPYSVRLTHDEERDFSKLAKADGCPTIGEWLRVLGNQRRKRAGLS